ncbi:hypothetical protein SAMN05216274_10554 [Cryobacterium levicorallinum]|uniref:Uncharacterized protein n=1 Tax=Cryobacterium levicorallinum TaxID=995038 RepID=A0ABY1ECD0_9MICO|nr:hypothetical protein SAMN05216274_10554 [Cryobacterium levicorallinum]
MRVAVPSITSMMSRTWPSDRGPILPSSVRHSRAARRIAAIWSGVSAFGVCGGLFMRDVSFIGFRGMISRRVANARIMPRIVRECFARAYDCARCFLRKSSIRPTVTSRIAKFSK